MIGLVNANALTIPLADNTVQCIVTSPPYWVLRSYLDADDPNKCNELGSESTPALYVAHIVAVMRECWRVLKDDGTVWLNLGDSYASDTKGSGGPDSSSTLVGTKAEHNGQRMTPIRVNHGLKPKDLCGIPWRVAFALQEDGWYLRSDIIWSKPNPMPESVTDRPTKAHEYVFLLTKQAQYFYDAEAIKESIQESSIERTRYSFESSKRSRANSHIGDTSDCMIADQLVPLSGSRNARSVWTIVTSPYSGAHYATFPPELARRCILAGTSQRGECPVCGKAWARVVEKESLNPWNERKANGATNGSKERGYNENHGAGMSHDLGVSSNTTGWRAQCDHAAAPIPQIVLDPFCGSGTVGEVCRESLRSFVGLDLSLKYLHDNALPRAAQTNTQASMSELPLFSQAVLL
jgi:DNA modification methylase